MIDLRMGDCLSLMNDIPNGSVDCVITDPPYPDFYVDEYEYRDGILDFLNEIKCRQIIFWSKSAKFPLNHTAVHIWNKNPSNRGAAYERIFERDGGSQYMVFSYYMVNSTVAAAMTNDHFNEHPSQKPINLMKKLVQEFTEAGQTILDPFMGSGTTGVACVQTGRNFIGIEKDEKYFEIAKKRIEGAQLPLF